MSHERGRMKTMANSTLKETDKPKAGKFYRWRGNVYVGVDLWLLRAYEAEYVLLVNVDTGALYSDEPVFGHRASEFSEIKKEP